MKKLLLFLTCLVSATLLADVDSFAGIKFRSEISDKARLNKEGTAYFRYQKLETNYFNQGTAFIRATPDTKEIFDISFMNITKVKGEENDKKPDFETLKAAYDNAVAEIEKLTGKKMVETAINKKKIKEGSRIGRTSKVVVGDIEFSVFLNVGRKKVSVRATDLVLKKKCGAKDE